MRKDLDKGWVIAWRGACRGERKAVCCEFGAQTVCDRSWAPGGRRVHSAAASAEMPVPIRIVLAGGAEAFIRLTVRGPVTEGTFNLPGDPKEVEINPLESVLAQVKTEAWR